MGANSEQAQRGGLLQFISFSWVNENCTSDFSFYLLFFVDSQLKVTLCQKNVAPTRTWNFNWFILRTLCMHFICWGTVQEASLIFCHM